MAVWYLLVSNKRSSFRSIYVTFTFLLVHECEVNKTENCWYLTYLLMTSCSGVLFFFIVIFICWCIHAQNFRYSTFVDEYELFCWLCTFMLIIGRALTKKEDMINETGELHEWSDCLLNLWSESLTCLFRSGSFVHIMSVLYDEKKDKIGEMRRTVKCVTGIQRP